MNSDDIRSFKTNLMHDKEVNGNGKDIRRNIVCGIKIKEVKNEEN
jgi:hypothetical protein